MVCDKKQHPPIPARAPADVRSMIKACFAYAPDDRIPADALRDCLAMAAAKQVATPGSLDDSPFADDPPAGILCALSQQLMTEPVRASDGCVYERSVITLWLQNHSASPVNGASLSAPDLTPETELRARISSWIEDQASRLSDEQSSSSRPHAAVRAARMRWLQWAGFPEAAARVRSLPPSECEPVPTCSSACDAPDGAKASAPAADSPPASLEYGTSSLGSMDPWKMDTWVMGYLERYNKVM
eukprot:1943298-Prymnesium_polylepis.1